MPARRGKRQRPAPRRSVVLLLRLASCPSSPVEREREAVWRRPWMGLSQLQQPIEGGHSSAVRTPDGANRL
nr:unnamed protein product [Digitaria exilis]